MATVNGQFFNLGGGNVPQWNPVEKPNLIQAGKDTSPSVFIVSVDMTFTVDDVVQQTEGIECRKDAGVIDEIPAAYKPIEQVMANQSDLVEVVATLKQVVCVKG
jgi:hypothetical protein